MTDKITMIELFSGIGAQEHALRQIYNNYEIINTCDCDKDAMLSYAAMRFNLKEEMKTFNFPSKEQMIEELQSKNVGYDFQKSKHSITSRTSENKIKQYYIADRLSKNLGDISKVEKLPYADIVTYSSPCQSFSVAGKLAGAAKTCNVCGHKWDIDFSNPDYNYKCPVCGNTSLESTTSGLLAEVQRLLSISYQKNTLPKYLLLENVKNLVGKKFKPQFDAWVKWLDGIGYNTHYKVLNAKNFGIPQNRERIFAISIRKDIDDGTFQFPSEIPLTTRLKDILETNVDERYYISNERVNQILNSDFLQERLRARNNISDENPVRLTNIYGEQFGTGYAGNVWDKNGLSPTLQTAQGGNRQPLVVDEDPKIMKVGQLDCKFEQSGRIYDPNGIAPTIMSNSHGKTSGGYTSPKVIVEGEPFVVASRGRNPDNPSDRTTGAPTKQRLEPNLNGTTNCLTSVAKDNYVVEPQILRAERTEYGKAIRKQYEAGEIEEKIGNMREMRPRTDGIANTITTVQKDNYVCEPIVKNVGNIYPSNGQNGNIYDVDGISPTISAGVGKTGRGIGSNNAPKIIEPMIVEDFYSNRPVRIYNETAPTLRSERIGLKIIESNENIDLMQVGTLDGTGHEIRKRVYDENGLSPTLCGVGSGGNTEPKVLTRNIQYRIRKLTPKECWRLMGFTDEDCNRAAQYVSASSLYKQAGNSIVTNCLVAIFYSLFYKDSSDAYSKYLIDFHSK